MQGKYSVLALLKWKFDFRTPTFPPILTNTFISYLHFCTYIRCVFLYYSFGPTYPTEKQRRSLIGQSLSVRLWAEGGWRWWKWLRKMIENDWKKSENILHRKWKIIIKNPKEIATNPQTEGAGAGEAINQLRIIFSILAVSGEFIRILFVFWSTIFLQPKVEGLGITGANWGRRQQQQHQRQQHNI